jgi:hypothetical protein
MPFFFWMAVIIFVLGLIVAAFVGPAMRGSDDTYTSKEIRASRAVVLISTFLIAGLCTLIASATFIGSRTVGVPVTFGAVAGPTQGEGFGWVAPWERVERFDASVQTLEMTGDGNGQDGPCVTVRLANQTTACVDVIRLQWNLDPTGDVTELYRKYRSFDKIEPNLVKGQAMSALVAAFADFNPLAGINDETDKTAVKVPSVDDLAKEATSLMKVGSGIHIESFLLRVHYDGTTQQKLDDFAKAQAETRIATQNKKTATEIALGNAELAKNKSGSDPGVTYQNCLSLIRDLAARGQLNHLPPTFNCGDPKSQVIVQGGPR